MILSPYDTTALKDFILDKTLKALMVEQIEKRLVETELPGVFTVTHASPDVPQFNHPIIMDSGRHSGSGFSIVFDARAMMRQQTDGSYRITAQDAYDLQLRRCALMKAVQLRGFDELISLGNLPLTVYTNWLSASMGRTLNLDLVEMVNARIIISAFFLSLSRSDDNKGLVTDDRSASRVTTVISRATKAPPETALSVLQTLEPMYTIIDLTNALKTHGNSVRFNSYNPLLLYNSIAGSWFGDRELTLVALEHLPTFYAMLTASIKQPAFKATMFSKALTNSERNTDGPGFVRGVNDLVNSLKSQ